MSAPKQAFEARGLPADLFAEQLILGAVVLDGEAMHNLRGLVEVEDFTHPMRRSVWRTMVDLYDRGTPLEIGTIFAALERNNEHAGAISFMQSQTEGVPLLPNLDYHIGKLRNAATLRRMMGEFDLAIQRCASGIETAQQIMESVSQQLLTVSPQIQNSGLQSVGEIMDEVGLQNLLRPRRERGLPFPWPWMNHSTSGMLPSELWVLAGNTSAGKTSAMLQLCVALARAGKGTGIFSLEVARESLSQKAIYQLARVDSERAKRGQLGPEERAQVHRAAEELHELPLYIDTQCTTVPAIHAAIRRRRLKSPVDVVAVDYLQLLGNTGRVDNRAQAVGANAWALKMLATEFQVPVLMLSQFSRQSTKAGTVQPRPELSWLKESGDIENHANGVWFIHRESMEDSDLVSVEFMLPKQRDGRRNIGHQYQFYPQYQRFEEVI